MSTIIIILAIIAVIFVSVFLAIKAYNSPKVQKIIAEREEARNNARSERIESRRNWWTRRKKRPKVD